MADATSELFTEKAANKLRSPDDLDNFLRVTNPSVWVVLGACIALVIGLFAWGFFGTATTSVGGTGTYVSGDVICFLTADQASKVHEGDGAIIGGKKMSVESISSVPVSRLEARDIVGSDFLTNTLVQDDWVYVVKFKVDGDVSFDEGIPLTVSVTTENIAPISLIFGGA